VSQFESDLQEAIMTAFVKINAHPTAKGEAIDMDRLVNDQNLDRFRRLVFSSEAEKFCSVCSPRRKSGSLSYVKPIAVALD
jgi:hypothetical protein